MRLKSYCYNSDGVWNAKVVLLDGKERSLSSRVRASSKELRCFKAENAEIRRAVEWEIYRRTLELNLKVEKRSREYHWTVAEVAEMYLIKRSVHKKSAKDDRCRFRKLIEYWGDRELASITRDDVDEFLYAIENRLLKSDADAVINSGSSAKRATATVKRYYELLRGLFYHVEMQFPRTRHDLRPTYRRRVFSDDETQRLLSAAHQVDPEFCRFVTFAFCTGARQGNIIDLKWENVNLEAGTFFNETSKNGEPITTGLNERAKQVLTEQRMVSPEFQNGRVWRWKNFQRDLWNETVEKSGVKDIRFHDIRHHVVTQVANRHGIHIAKEVAHHKSIMTTQIYVNPTAEKVMQAFADIRVPEILTSSQLAITG